MTNATESDATKPTLGFLGLGRMGSPMALRLLAAGYPVVACDPVPAAMRGVVERGAQSAASPREVADRADIVLTSLPTPDVVQSVALGEAGLVHGSRAQIFVDLSTTGPRMSAAVGAALAERGRLVMVDCPVSGGVAGAQKGTLSIMMAGPEVACERVRPVLSNLGRMFASRPPRASADGEAREQPHVGCCVDGDWLRGLRGVGARGRRSASNAQCRECAAAVEEGEKPLSNNFHATSCPGRSTSALPLRCRRRTRAFASTKRRRSASPC